MTPTYLFSPERTISVSLVALPQRRVRTPVANGSSVPPWPSFLIPSRFLAHEASW